MKAIKAIFSLEREIKEISKLASPLVITQLAQVALSTIDIIMLGMLGTKSLAVGGLAIAIFSLFRTFANGIISAISNIIAYEYGKNPLSPTIKPVVRAGFILASLLAIFFYFITWVVQPVLIISGQDSHIIPLTMEYLRVMLIGMAPCLWFLVLRNFTVGLKHPGKLMIFTLISVALKIIFNYVFMFGVFGTPALGLLGVAWAGNLVFLLSFLMFGYSIARNPSYATFDLWSIRVVCKVTDILKVLKTGMPIAVTYVAESGFFMVIALLMGSMGEVALAAHTVVNQCVYVTFMIAVGISHASSMSIGNAFGAGKYSDIRRYAYAALLLGFMCMSISGLFFWLFNQQIMHIFIRESSSLNDQVAELGARLLIVAAVFQVFDGWQNIALGLLRGIKAMKLSMLISLFGYWLIGLPLAYLFGFHTALAAVGIWCGLACGLAVTAILLVICFARCCPKDGMVH